MCISPCSELPHTAHNGLKLAKLSSRIKISPLHKLTLSSVNYGPRKLTHTASKNGGTVTKSTDHVP